MNLSFLVLFCLSVLFFMVKAQKSPYDTPNLPPCTLKDIQHGLNHNVRFSNTQVSTHCTPCTFTKPVLVSGTCNLRSACANEWIRVETNDGEATFTKKSEFCEKMGPLMGCTANADNLRGYCLFKSCVGNAGHTLAFEDQSSDCS